MIDYLPFERFLKQTMGLDASSIGSSAIEHAVRTRMLACRLNDTSTYLESVRTSATELQELIEAVVVPETWFFRDREAFVAMTRMAFEEWLRTHADGVMRLLSLPCSSGEEPYSMAMALLDAGFPPNHFHIDAVDISARVLAHGRRAVYGKNSFRGSPLDFRDRYFESTPQGHRLSDAVRQQVSFHHANLIASDFLPGAGIYDIIFCRNLLIYFDRPTQDTVLRVLQRLINPKGMLFVGPSETGLMVSHDFASARIPLAFAYRKSDAASRATAPASLSLNPPVMHTTRAPRSLAKPMLPPSPPPTVPVSYPLPKTSQASTQEESMERAMILANQGRLAEAEMACQEHLRNHGSSSQIFYLLGLIRDANGILLEAAHYYRKALYLDPNHSESLAHLAFLLEKQGDAKGAQVLRSRGLRTERKRAK